jgi:GGDEF domain-containing protein
MHVAEYETTPELNAKVQILGALLDDFTRIIKQPDTPAPKVSGLTDLRNKFNTAHGMAKSVFILKLEDPIQANSGNNEARRLKEQQLTAQLKQILGNRTPVAAIGEGEYAILLLGYDQCADLIPRLEELTARTQAILCTNDASAARFSIGVARTPMDTEDLQSAIVMASAAASEFDVAGPRYQFVSRRHKSYMK